MNDNKEELIKLAREYVNDDMGMEVFIIEGANVAPQLLGTHYNSPCIVGIVVGTNWCPTHKDETIIQLLDKIKHKLKSTPQPSDIGEIKYIYDYKSCSWRTEY